jgi:hypothetical protein
VTAERRNHVKKTEAAWGLLCLLAFLFGVPDRAGASAHGRPGAEISDCREILHSAAHEVKAETEDFRPNLDQDLDDVSVAVARAGPDFVGPLAEAQVSASANRWPSISGYRARAPPVV